MASLARFGFLLLVLAIVAKAQPQESDSSEEYNFEKLEELSQRILAMEQESTDQLKHFESILDTIAKRRLSNKTINQDISVSKAEDGLSKYRQDMVTAIIEKRFAFAAEEMLKKYRDRRLSFQIVGDVYQDSETNIQVILDFAKSLSNKNLKYEILTSLYNKWNDQKDTLQKIALAKAYSEIIGDAEPVPDVFESLLHNITTSTIDRLTDIIKSDDDYGNNEEAKSLSAAIVGLRDVPKRVMLGLLEKAQKEVGDRKLFQVVYTHSEPWQALIGLDYIINELQKRNEFKKSHPLDVASALNKIKSTANFDSAQSEFLNLTLKKIPECIMNLVSLPKFCIVHNTNRYLTLTPYTIKINGKKPVLTLHESEVNDRMKNMLKWQLNRTGDVLYFHSPYYTNLVMVSAAPGESNTSKQIHAYKMVNEDLSLHKYKGFLVEPWKDSCVLMSEDGEYVVGLHEGYARSRELYKAILSPDRKEDDHFYQIKKC